MKITIKHDSSVFNTLKQAKKEEVDYLVDVLTDHGEGRIALSSSVKDLLLTEKNSGSNYTDDALKYVIFEFQQFGGNSALNMFRKEPLSYAEIRDDVYKKLNGGQNDKKSGAQKEKEIVLGLFGEEWIKLSDHERFERSTEIKVLAGLFKISENIVFNEKGVVFGMSAVASFAAHAALRVAPLTTAFASISIMNQAFGEAYRITVPFVAQISWIRMRIAQQ